MMKEAQYYSGGDMVRFGRDYQQIHAAKGDYMRVVNSVDAPYGTVILQKQDGTVIHWEPKKHNKVEVYKTEERQVAQGDLIRMTRSDGQFKNGEIGRVIATKGDQVTLEVKQGTIPRQHDINLSTSKHWDYAYASTVHSAQGATQYRTLFHIRAKESDDEQKDENNQKWLAKIFGNRSFYVDITRATHEMTIYTNNKEEALKVITQKQDKTSSLEEMNKKMLSKEVPDKGTISGRENRQMGIHQVHEANYLR